MKKKYSIYIPVEYLIGHLRCGHYEGVLELTDEEYEQIKQDPDLLKEWELHYNLELLVDDYRIEDCGPLEVSELQIQEVE